MTADARVDAADFTCGQLEPAIAQALRRLMPGQVLAVSAGRSEAAGGIRAWVALTGHALLAVEGDGDHTRYYIRKKG